MNLSMDKSPENAEEALYQGLVMQLLPRAWSESERSELEDIVRKLEGSLPESVVNALKFKAMCKFMGVGESNVG
jgi:hypothetical protein